MRNFSTIFYQIEPTGQHHNKSKAVFQDLEAAKIAFENLKKFSKYDWKIYEIKLTNIDIQIAGSDALITRYRIQKTNLQNAKDTYKQFKDSSGEMVGQAIGVDEIDIGKAVLAVVRRNHKQISKVVV